MIVCDALLLFKQNCEQLTITVLQKLSTKPSVESGFSMKFLVGMMKTFVAETNGEVEKLLVLLRNAKLDQDSMLDLMPQKDRSADELNNMLNENGLEKLVEQYGKRKKITKLNDLTEGVTERVEVS